ncbi:hypothetical protein [Xylanibacter ruminicola]|uniref:hypothetical protein n=1 Tax=Xylanibacter ruminicola TaxID=839 RepID=UPI00068B4911|nr:hypothetical protein [Xylanibacter ruminicola]
MIYRIVNKGKKFAYLVKNREDFIALRNTKENLDNLAKARKGDEKAKAQLVQFAYNIGVLNSSVLAGCKSIGSYFFHDVDCYDAEQSAAMAQQILAKKDEIGLMLLEKSASGGYHLVCKRLPGTTILENQVRIATILQIEMDTNVHDLQRVVFSTSGDENDLLYLNDELFEEPMTAEECEAEYARLKERERKGEEQVPAGAKKARKHYKPWLEELGTNFANLRELINNATEDKNKIRDNSCNSCQNKTVDERVRFVMEAVLKAKGLEKSDFTDIGGRHNAVKIFLSGANQLLSKEEANGALAELMPEHWADENIQACVADFYDKYYNPTQKLTKDQEGIFTQSRRLKENESSQPTLELDANTPMHELTKLFASETPPAIPKDVPKLVKAVTCNTPDKYKATVAQAMFPGLMAYPKKLNFVYIDNQVRELRANCLIVAGTGTGKDSCTKQPLTRIIADMKARDEENRKRLKEFNDEFNSKASNKQKPQRPADLIIQTIKSDITKAALVQRMDEAQGAPLYVRINELEQWDKIEGSTGRGNQFTTLKLCDDEGNDYGTDRAGTQSVMGSGSLHLNWNANTTTAKAIKYFRYVLTDGPISRLCLATIPEEEIGAEISVFGTYDEKYDAALKPYIENLKQATGTIDCKEARKLARKLKDECADFARLSQDRVFDNLSHRALVIAFRKACLLYAANGMKWEKSIETFCRWSLFYDLYIKMTVFGDLIRHADDDIQTSKRGPQNLLVMLPTNFTLDDAKRVRQQQGYSTDTYHTKKMIRSWIYREYVTQETEHSFKKALITEGKK